MATEQEKQAYREAYRAAQASGGSTEQARAAGKQAAGKVSTPTSTGTYTASPNKTDAEVLAAKIAGRKATDAYNQQHKATSGRMTNSGTRRQYVDNLLTRQNELKQTISGSNFSEVQSLINSYKDIANKWSAVSSKQRSLERQNPFEAVGFNAYLEEADEYQKQMDDFRKRLEKYGITVNGSSVDASKYNQIYFDSLKGNATDASAEYVPANGLLRDSTTLDVDEYLGHVGAEEMQLYNYLAANKPEEAEAFRQYLDNLVQQRIGGERTEQILDKYTASGRAVSRGAEAFKSGLAGAYNAVVATATGEDRKTSASEYAAEQLRADLLSKGDEWWRTAGFDAMQSIGNMTPGVVAGMINPTAGMAVFGATSGTMAYQDKLAEGWGAQEARNYGLLVGASEAALGKVMGGIPALGGMEGGLLNKLTGNVNNAIAKAVLNGAGQMGSEALEEGLQTLIEPAIVSAIKGTPYDTPELKEVLYSAVLGAVTAAGFNAPNTAVEAADAASAYKGRYGADAQTLVNEAKQIKDADKALVSKAQSKLDKGKSISNNTAQQLTTTVNRSRMVDAVEAQINERASDMDAKAARSLANAVVAKSRNERLTNNQKKLIDKNKDLAGQLAQEINPKAPADWAKRVGMRGEEARAYGDRNLVNAVEQYEQKTLTGGEYAEARADLIEQGQNRVEYTDDFDYVAEVYGNTRNFDNFDEVWDAVKDETVLTQAQARAAWEAGRSKLSLADNASKLTRRGTGAVSFEAVIDGGVQYEAPTADEIDSFKRGARYQYLETLAKKIGVDIVFFKGGAEGINGKYLDGTVYLAIDASPSVSESVNGYVMLTAAHELTHYIREASPARYAELKDFIIKHIIDKGKVEGKTFKQLIEDKRRAYARANVELSVDNAIEEVVADACEMMLKDNTLVAQLRNENDTLYGSVSKWLKKFMRKVRTAFKGLEAHHTEARAIEDSFRELQRIWNLGLTEATQAEVTEDGQSESKYSFAGRKSETADDSLYQQALDMEKAGKSSEDIRKETGWFKGMDGQWRYEIDDADISLKVSDDIPNYISLGNLVDAPTLFSAYPDLAERLVIFQTLGEGKIGSYSVSFGDFNLDYSLKNNSEELLDVLVHEVQHAIQQIEGFDSGSNTVYWDKQIAKGFDTRTKMQRSESARLEREYRMIEETDPEFFEEASQLMLSLPTVPRGKFDFEKFEQVEPDPPEWEQFDERRDALQEKYGNKLYDFMKLFETLRATMSRGTRNSQELYYSTAGEIEARDTTSRRTLTAEQRKNTRPDIEQEDVVFADGAYTRDISGGKYAIKYPQFSEEDIKKNSETLRNMDVVKTLSGDEFKDDGNRLFDNVTAFFNSLGNNVYSDVFGDVALTRSSARSDIRHGLTKNKITSFAAIPEVIKNGTVIDYFKKGSDLERIVVAAPISISDERYYMGVMLQRDKSSQRLYLHDVVIEKEPTSQTAEHLSTTGPLASEGKLYITNILHKALGVNENTDAPRTLSIKDEAQSDRMLLANTLMTAAQNDGERRRLNNYKAQIDLFDEIQEQLEAAEEELSRAYRAGDKKAIAKAQKERNALTEKLIKADSKLTELQATKPLKELLSRVRQDTRRNTQRSTRERRDKSELRKKIKTLHSQMSSQLLNPKENRYVPKPLLKTVAELLDLINLDSGRSEKIKAKLAELSGQYKKIANDNNYSYVFDSDVADMIATLQGVIAEKDDTSIYHMSKDELQMVYDTMKAINHTARTAVKLIGYEERRNIFELAKDMMRETNRANPVANKLANKYINATLRPDVFFKRMGGYVKNSVWQLMGNMLNEAQRKQTQIQMEGAAIFEELMRDTKAFDRMTNHKELIDIGLEDNKGNPVMVTRDIAMKIYMDTMAEDNARHLMSGGYTVPAMREYYKGRASEAFARGSVTIHGFGPLLSDLQHQLRHAETEAEQAEIQQKIDKAEADAAKWVENLRRNIYDQLGDYELEWIRAAEMFFNDYSQRVLNETTMAVYGFEKATVPYYVPIHTDPAYRQANFESISRDMSLENSGFMKARIEGAKNPMLAEGLVDIINGQIDKVAKYAAMMPAIRNFQKVYGKSTAGYESSVQSEVRSKFGNEALKYIENIITDLTSPRYTEGGLLGDFANQLRGNLAQAALTVNPRVALEQVTSYPKAAVVVGYEPLIKAFRDLKDNPVRDQTAREEIAKWTPLMWYRMQGYFDRDIGDLRNDKQMLNKVNKKLKFIAGWIEAVEGSTVGQMWYAAQYYVEDTTNLERGTDEFMQETAKVFNRIVEQTQANYTMFQRPDILRNPNAIVKQLTMFMTERLQNANMVFDAVGTYNAYLKDFRNGENDVSEDDVKQAKQTVVRTASSLIAATASSVALKLLVDMLMYSMKGYRDEDEELTMASITGQVIENFFESAAGNFLWGSELFSIMRSVVTDETYYGISLGGVETFTDALNALVKTMQEPTWENWKKSIKTGMQMLGIPLNNGIKIYNAIAYRIKDVQEGNGWGSYASELKLTEEQIAKQLYNAAITDNEKRLNDLFEHYGTEAAADAALAKHIKGLYQNDELSAEEAIVQLKEYASMSEYDAKLAVDKLRFEKEHGFDYNDMKQQYIDGNITDSEAVKWRIEYGDQDQSDAEKEVNQWRMKKETGFEYDKIKDYLTSGDITKQQAIEYRMEYGGQDLEDATVYITKLMGEIETGIPYDKVEDYYRDGLVSYDELVDYYMQYWSYDELKAIQVADKRKFIGTDESLADASLAAVSGYYGYCDEADVDKRTYLTAYQTCYAIRADKDANGKSVSGTALKKKLVYIDGLNLQPYQKTAVAKAIGITDKQLKKYKAAWL